MFNWGIALAFLKDGKRVTRQEWIKRGRSQYLFLIKVDNDLIQRYVLKSVRF